ncbi:hypothetical protein [Bradyrhizobium brasilense]|uniref:hypothetical protein n=1 Tax=Bradyrhizobium brasilense TaxID=1419277 RepID=UPI001E3C7AF5|nr:hypothetical protein [Bradyrhizobium brasilense]MCC8972863.1 hypothetical protein [Bradyrhizobium brasilense]
MERYLAGLARSLIFSVLGGSFSFALALEKGITMKADIPAYGVIELTPEEASATSGGVFWAIVGVLAGLAASIAAGGLLPGGK